MGHGRTKTRKEDINKIYEIKNKVIKLKFNLKKRKLCTYG